MPLNPLRATGEQASRKKANMGNLNAISDAYLLLIALCYAGVGIYVRHHVLLALGPRGTTYSFVLNTYITPRFGNNHFVDLALSFPWYVACGLLWPITTAIDVVKIYRVYH